MLKKMKLKTFTKLYYRYKDLVYKYISTCRDLIKQGILNPCYYGDVINKAKRFKSDTSKPGQSMTNLLPKGYNFLFGRGLHC